MSNLTDTIIYTSLSSFESHMHQKLEPTLDQVTKTSHYLCSGCGDYKKK